MRFQMKPRPLAGNHQSDSYTHSALLDRLLRSGDQILDGRLGLRQVRILTATP